MSTTTTTTSIPIPTLLNYLSSSFSSFPGTHTYTLQIIKSQPRRSHALFSHSSNHKTCKIYQEEILILLSEELDLPVVEEKIEGEIVEVGKIRRKATLPVVALEANIYTIPSTSTSLLYISKVDTTGLPPSTPSSPSPARTLISSFITYNLLYPPHETKRLRIHIFAKSQDQYLFPGSIENEHKKVLTDQGLLRWWKGTLTEASDKYLVQKKEKEEVSIPIKQYYFIPGLTQSESLTYVPLPPSTSTSTTDSTSYPWIYSHAFSLTSSPLHLPSQSPQSPILTDLIPSFPDDPKSRFLHSLSSSSIPCSGTKDDYDDVMNSLHSNSFTVGYTSTSKLEEIENQREKERKRLVEGIEGGVEEWWERMGFRQECCSGVLVGFFAVVRDEEEPSRTEGEGEGGEWEIKIKLNRLRSSLNYKTFIGLWSSFHNVDYSWKSILKMIEMTKKWEEDVERLILFEGFELSLGEGINEGELLNRRKEGYELEVKKKFEVKNLGMESRKRVVVEEKVVNVMVPRKKKPKVVV